MTAQTSHPDNGPCLGGPLTDLSGTVTNGTTSQQVAPLTLYRKYILIQNPVGATETLFFNFGAAASVAGGSIGLAAGQIYERAGPTFVPTDAINVTATTTGHAFTIKVG